MRSLVGTHRDLDDLTQVALERLLRGIGGFDGRSELSTFTYRICLRVAMNQWRGWRRWFRRFELGTPADEPRDDADVEDDSIERQKARRVQALMERLPPAKRAVLVLSYLEELPASRIAEILECPEATVRSRLRDALNLFGRLAAQDPVLRESTQIRGDVDAMP
jgi:RNA polymerase sigma-70 factor (ECF subfamily)